MRRLRREVCNGEKLHPDYQGFMVDDKKMEPVYEEIERLGLPGVCFTQVLIVYLRI